MAEPETQPVRTLPSVVDLVPSAEPEPKTHPQKKPYSVEVKGREVEVAYRSLKSRKGVR
jgi:hypothetical protein